MLKYRIVSSDSHVFEPPDLWTKRVHPKFAEYTPRLVSYKNTDMWHCMGYDFMPLTGGLNPGVRFESQDKLRSQGRWAEVALGGYIPAEHVKVMDEEGVDGAVLYASAARWLYRVPFEDPQVLGELFRCYNDWLAEYCDAYPTRLRGIANLTSDDIPGAVAELHRVARMGLVGAMITVYPLEGRTYDSPMYEPLWAAAEELRMPLSLHVNSNRIGSVPKDAPKTRDTINIHKRVSQFVSAEYWAKLSLADMALTGVFDRHPGLNMVTTEHETAWAPYFMEMLDYNYSQRTKKPGFVQLKDQAMPSEHIREHVYYSFQEDRLGIELRRFFGSHHLMWGTDYPHPETTYPRTQAYVDQLMAGLSPAETSAIIADNTERLYRYTFSSAQRQKAAV